MHLAELAVAAVRIHRVNQMIDNNYMRRLLGLLEQRGKPVEADKMLENATQFDIKLSSVDIGAEFDFGIPGTGDGVDGRARWVRKPWVDDKGTVKILPRRENADFEVLVCLEEEQLEMVRRSLEGLGFTTAEDFYLPRW
ncbi:hypothetical protein F5Y06DRAFT_193592 [Hypoxylon sp. FL0890]|nr:hypothetical protein F5Y06DRAFT_193592 [Hypoxylon sp. FL0890]